MRLNQPYSLPCGLQLPNRIVKAAMAEHMSDKTGLPNAGFERAYGTWANGGWGMIITGNVQVDERYLGGNGDVCYTESIPRHRLLTAWRGWAKVCQQSGTPTIVQINHPGRQTPAGAGSRGIFAKSLAPSAIPLDFGRGLVAKTMRAVVFGTPREMTVAEIEDVIRRFADTAQLSAEAGFSGVEIHAAHGYLLAQFLSDKSNTRQDRYGGSPAARVRILVEIIRAIRVKVPKHFAVGIKLNSADHQSATELDAFLEQLGAISKEEVDFVEVSGGTYENPEMFLGVKTGKGTSQRTQEREAFFLEFASAIRDHLPTTPLMVTGGFRTRTGMEKALSEGDCDLLGIARPAVMNPTLPDTVIFNAELDSKEARLYARRINTPWYLRWMNVRALGAGVENVGYLMTVWYSSQIRLLGN